MAWVARRFSSSPNRLTPASSPCCDSTLCHGFWPKLRSPPLKRWRPMHFCRALPSSSTARGYSPDFFAELKAQRIAILTYHKFPGEKWPLPEFAPHSVRLHNGESIELQLAERGTRLSNGLWVREVRKLSASSGAQSSILSTDMRLDLTRIAADIAARWSQENFLKYMREH